MKYFAYDFNMNHKQFRERAASAQFLGPARLDGYRLAFTRHSKKRGSGVADIVATNGASIWGGLFDLSPNDLMVLDRSEGTHLAPPAYRRIEVEVTSQDVPNCGIQAFTYEVAAKSSFKPSAAYLDTIVQGAANCRLPADYIRTLRTIEVA